MIKLIFLLIAFLLYEFKDFISNGGFNNVLASNLIKLNTCFIFIVILLLVYLYKENYFVNNYKEDMVPPYKNENIGDYQRNNENRINYYPKNTVTRLNKFSRDRNISATRRKSLST